MMQVALVGCGGIGAAHARAYSQIDGVTVSAFVDRDLQRASTLAAELGGEPLQDTADLPDSVRVVSVATDPASHFDVAMALLRQNRHVFCEKPLGMTAPEARELSRTAGECGVKLSVGFKMRYEPCFVRAKELVSEVGQIVCISATKVQPFELRPNDWRPQVGAMFELSVHDFDLISFITGLQPVTVHSARLSRRLGWEREDGFAAVVEYDGGAVASLCGNYTTDSKWQGRDFALTITGERGYLRVLRGDQVILHTDGYVSEPVQAPGNTFVEELAGFIAAVRDDCEPPIPAAAGVNSTCLIDGIWQSGSKSEPVSLSELGT